MNQSTLPDQDLLSVADALALYPTLGIPHFQRGSVWSDGARGRLLESLFHDTPCGSMIVWRPAGPAAGSDAPGLPLPGNRIEDVTWLVIDGQQRLRALHATLSNGEADEPEKCVDDPTAGPKETGLAKVWCLNLQALPELTTMLAGRLADQPLFVRIGDPHPGSRAGNRDRRNPRYRFNLWPLNLLRRENKARLSEYELKCVPGRNSEDVWSFYEAIVERACAMETRRFFVIRRAEDKTSGRFDLDEMVHLYNRINSAGVRVEAEERAFATMVRLEPRTSQWLGDLFETIHTTTDPLLPGTAARDQVLRRAQERSFGFRFFMRTLVHCASYHSGRSLGSSGLSFELLGASDLIRDLAAKDETGEAMATQLLERAGRAVVSLATSIKTELGCDAFQFLPETASLLAPLELAIAYEHAPELSALVPWLVLVLMVGEWKPRDLLRLASAVRGAPDLVACKEILLRETGLRISEKTLASRLAASNAIQDRFVLLLYWLVRRNGARDLSYENVPLNSSARGAIDLRSLRGQEPLITASMHGRPGVPEKQHIVPFSILENFIKDAQRSGMSAANNIGNLTYISPSLNHYDGGIGAIPMGWDFEPEHNLRAHLLLTPPADAGPNPLRALFATAIDDEELPITRERAFASFCHRRREIIARALYDWTEELRARAEAVHVGAWSPAVRILRSRRDAPNAPKSLQSRQSIAATLPEESRAVAEQIMHEFDVAGFETLGTPSSLNFGFTGDDGEFHSLVNLNWAGFWMNLKKRDCLRLGEPAVLAFRHEAQRFGRFFGDSGVHADMTGGCAVKPKRLETQVTEFAAFLVNWRCRLEVAISLAAPRPPTTS